MSRDDGFAIADMDSAMLEDAKVKRLWRELGPDVGRMCHALKLYDAAVLASWRHGRRVKVTEAVPTWLPADPDLVAALQRVGLLDGTERVCLRAWHGWFDPAWERREKRREAGAKGGRTPRKAPLKRRSSSAEPDRPSGRSVGASSKQPSRARSNASGAATRDEASESLAEIRRRLEGNGTLHVSDRGGLLSEPMPADVSAEIPVEVPA